MSETLRPSPMRNPSNAADTDQPRLAHVTCASPAGVHRMAYWEWGDPDNDRVLLCVHGLTRSGRDFDPLARRLSAHYRVVCPDIVGRGRSDWLVDPAHYRIPQYVADMVTLIARLRPAQLDWIGTSMGGLIAMGLSAALAMSARMRPDRGMHGLPESDVLALGRVVLNDIGPIMQLDALARIAAYVGEARFFDSFDKAVDYIREVSADFGEHDQAGWEALTRNVFTEQDGVWGKHYDLRIAQAMAQESPDTIKASETLLWTGFEALSAPVLIVRGELSDLLSAEVAQTMLQRNPRASLHTVAQTGHAPTLRTDSQIAPIERFLLQDL